MNRARNRRIGLHEVSPQATTGEPRVCAPMPKFHTLDDIDVRGKTVLECNRGELSKKLKARDLVILTQSPDASLFERIIQGVLGRLGAA